MDGFDGYAAPALPLLNEIGCSDRAWFAEHREEYVEHLLEPSRRLVTAIGAELRDAVPGLQAVPKVNGSIAPITNDQRFRDLPPYRDHLVLRFWSGADRLAGPSMYVRIAATGIGFGAGMPLDADRRAAFREAVADGGGQELAGLLAGLQRRHSATLHGPRGKRVPAPYPADHPRGDLLKLQRLQVQWSETVPRAIASGRFVPWCSRRLLELAGVSAWLHEYVVPSSGEQ
jgi:uncharacterized protein (DUF2461 family)